MENPQQADPQELNKEKVKKPLAKRLIRDIIITLIVGISAFYGYLYFFIQRPEGSGPAGPDVPIAPFEKVWSEEKVILLGIGDSITDGYGATGYGSPKALSYFNRLISNPEVDSDDIQGRNLSKVYPNLTSKNISISGSVSEEHLNKHIAELEPFPSDVTGIVVMTSGGNDIIHQYGEAPPKECAM